MRSPGTPGPPSGFHAGLCAHVSAPVSVSENYSGQASPSLYAPFSLCLRLQPSPPSPSQALLPLLGATWSTPRSPSPPEPSADRGPSQAFPRPKPAGFHVCLGGGSTPWKAKPQKAWVLLSGLPQHWRPGSALPRRAPAPGAEGAVSVFPRMASPSSRPCGRPINPAPPRTRVRAPTRLKPIGSLCPVVPAQAHCTLQGCRAPSSENLRASGKTGKTQHPHGPPRTHGLWGTEMQRWRAT